MTTHDAALTHFSQWWRRTVRSGYAFAEGAFLHGAPPERHWVWESRQAWIWGIFLPILCLAMTVLVGNWGFAIWLIYPFQIVRLTFRGTGSMYERAASGLFQVLGRFPEGLGQLKFLRDRLLGRQAFLIEYK